MLRKVAVGAVVGLLFATGAFAQTRVSDVEKGSLFMFPKVELRWNAAGDLIQDTFIDIANDNTADVKILLYFVAETCTQVDNDIVLTINEPAYWSCATGLPKGVNPFTVLGAPYNDPEGSTDKVLRGFIYGWAVDANHNQIRWNHLYGDATIVNYEKGYAWSYNAYTFAAVVGDTGFPIGEPGVINLGGEYAFAFNKLLMDFYAVGATAFSGGGRLVTHDTDLTLLIVDQDLRQDTLGPYKTKATFELWNQNEVSFSGTHYCITKWDQSLLSTHGGQFLLANLLTNKGRARIDGIHSTLCDTPNFPSTDRALLGVAVKLLTFDNGDVTAAGNNLFGTGTEATTILYDVLSGPEEQHGMPGAGPAGADRKSVV